MKKIIISIFALAAVLVVSCDKQPQPAPDGDNPAEYNYEKPKIAAPANLDTHFSMIVDPGLPQTGMKNTRGLFDKVKNITFPPGHTGIIEFEQDGPKEVPFKVVESTRAMTKVEFQTSGIIQSISASWNDDNVITLEAKLGTVVVPLSGRLEVPASSFVAYVQDVCRNWDVVETIVRVTGDDVPADLGVSKTFTGCDLNKIVDYVIDKGIKVDPVGSEYNIKKLMLDPSGKFGVFYEGRDPSYGVYKLQGNKFSYTIANDQLKALAGEVTGKLSIINSFGRLELNATLHDVNGKHYAGEAILKLQPEVAR